VTGPSGTTVRYSKPQMAQEVLRIKGVSDDSIFPQAADLVVRIRDAQGQLVNWRCGLSLGQTGGSPPRCNVPTAGIRLKANSSPHISRRIVAIS
jgi:hypothetical protein